MRKISPILAIAAAILVAWLAPATTQAQTAGDEFAGVPAQAPLDRFQLIQAAIDAMNARAVSAPGGFSESGEAGGDASLPAAWTAFGVVDRGAGVCNLSVALVAADSAANTADVSAKLLPDPRIASVSVINTVSVTPTFAELQAFDAVLVWTNSTPLSSVDLGDNLAEYVDAGGGVVLAMFAMRASLAARTIEGRFLTDNYYCIERTVGGSTTGAATLGTVFVQGSPVMAGVGSFNGGTSSFRSPGAPHPLATRVADWSTGEVLVATRDDLGGTRVDLGFFPVSSSISAGNWQIATDGAVLMANAISHAAGCPHVGTDGCDPSRFSQAPPNATLQSRNSNTPANTVTDQQEADDFTIPGGGTIGRITLWGVYFGDLSVPESQHFVINIHNSVANNPGAIIHTTSAQVVPEPTGLIQTGYATPARLYRFTIDLPVPFVAAAGTTYWLSPLGDNADKVWSWQFVNTTGSRRFRLAGAGAWSTANDGHFAFELCRTCTGGAGPVVDITAPASFSCVCNSVTVVGSVSDPDGDYDDDVLEYRRSDLNVWVPVLAGAGQRAGNLYVWAVPGALAEGYYFLRVTGRDVCGNSASDTTLVYINRDFDTIDLRSPVTGGIYGGVVCFDGTAFENNCFRNYTVHYRALPAGGFAPVDPAQPFYTPSVINDPLASWSTAAGPTAVADGNYEVRLRGTDDCANSEETLRTIRIDNTAPIAIISSPTACTYVDGDVQVRGTASDANLAGWTLQYTGGNADQWVTINSGNANVVNGVLGTWNTAGLRICAYTLRLVVSDQAGVNCSGNTHQVEDKVSLIVGCQGDVDFDGDIDLTDLAYLLTVFGSVCP